MGTLYRALVIEPKRKPDVRELRVEQMKNIIGRLMTTMLVTLLDNGRRATALLADDRDGLEFTTELEGIPLYGPIVVVGHDATGEMVGLTREEIARAAGKLGYAAPSSLDDLEPAMRVEFLAYVAKHGKKWRDKLAAELGGGERTIGPRLEQALLELGPEWLERLEVGSVW